MEFLINISRASFNYVMITSVRNRRSLFKAGADEPMQPGFANIHFNGFLERPNTHGPGHRMFMCVQDPNNLDNVAFCGDKVMDMVSLFNLLQKNTF